MDGCLQNRRLSLRWFEPNTSPRGNPAQGRFGSLIRFRLMQPDAALRRCLPLVDGGLHPPVDGDVIDCDPVLGQQLLHIAVNRL